MKVQRLLLFLLWVAVGILSATNCLSDTTFQFEGSIDPTIESNYKYHKLVLPKDGLVKITVIYEPKDKLGNDRLLWGNLNVPDYLETCTRGFTRSLYSGGFVSGEIYGPFPAQAGLYQLMLNPPWRSYDEPYQYLAYINYETSVPPIADKDPTEGYNAFCTADKFDDWGTLDVGSIRYGHIGYRRCQYDDCDNYNFKVAETGLYQFLFRSNQADFTASVEDNNWQTCKPYAFITTPDLTMKFVSLNLYRDKAAHNYLYQNLSDEVVLTKGVQYVVRFDLYGPYDPSHETDRTWITPDYAKFYNKCYGALAFMLVRGIGSFPLILSNVEYAKVDMCGSTEEIAVTVTNPDEYSATGQVSYSIQCVIPDEWASTGGPIDVTLAPDASKTVTFHVDIPKNMRGNNCQLRVWTDGINNPYYDEENFLHTGAINIHCGSATSFLMDLLLHSGDK